MHYNIIKKLEKKAAEIGNVSFLAITLSSYIVSMENKKIQLKNIFVQTRYYHFFQRECTASTETLKKKKILIIVSH